MGAFAIIGALNWGLISVADYNLIDHVLGAGSKAARVLYGLIGLSGAALLVSYFTVCPACKKD